MSLVHQVIGHVKHDLQMFVGDMVEIGFVQDGVATACNIPGLPEATDPSEEEDRDMRQALENDEQNRLI